MAALPLRESNCDVPSAAKRIIDRGREIMQSEIRVLEAVRGSLGDDFLRAVEILLGCRGKVLTCGMGKAGIIAQKLAASLSSTGTPSVFLHPADAVHGDLGSVQACDVVILLSYSGETEEVTRLLPSLNEVAAYTLAITARAESTLASAVDCSLLLGRHPEACSHNLAPSSSTTAMMAVGDALALVTSEQRGFTRDNFAQFHPGGSLGKRLSKVEEIMRPLQECRIAPETLTVRQVMIQVSRPGRRTGAIMLTDAAGRLSGVFTDSDLARLLERSDDAPLDLPVAQLMTRHVRVATQHSMLADALHLLTQAKISELPVVDQDYAPVGIVDVTDVLAVLPALGHTPDSADENGLPEDDSPPIFPIGQSRTSR